VTTAKPIGLRRAIALTHLTHKNPKSERKKRLGFVSFCFIKGEYACLNLQSRWPRP
jgi:hypothetical protein